MARVRLTGFATSAPCNVSRCPLLLLKGAEWTWDKPTGPVLWASHTGAIDLEHVANLSPSQALLISGGFPHEHTSPGCARSPFASIVLPGQDGHV